MSGFALRLGENTHEQNPRAGGKVLVSKRGRCWWHWCPCCQGGDWHHSCEAAHAAARAHVALHVGGAA